MTLALNLLGLSVLVLLVWLAVRGQATGDRATRNGAGGPDEPAARTREER